MFFFIILLSFSLFAIIFYNFQEPLRPTLPDPRPQNVDLSLKKITLTNSLEDSVSWRLVADSADFDISTKSGRLKNLQVTFFNEEEGDLELTADGGEVGAGGNSLRAVGHVVLRGKEGYALYCDELEYLQRESLLRSESRVHIVDDGLNLRGRGLRYQVRERLFELLHDIEAEVHDKNDLQG